MKSNEYAHNAHYFHMVLAFLPIFSCLLKMIGYPLSGNSSFLKHASLPGRDQPKCCGGIFKNLFFGFPPLPLFSQSGQADT